MRTIYLESQPTHAFSQPYYYKIIELDKETTSTITVTKDSIDMNKDEDFFDQVSFIKNKLCEGASLEITQEQFESFYYKTLEKINYVITSTI